ncbi:hypothetical protein [Sutcliffiella horikoshii]|uniref:hypothetical protein n=1 Tax=Sutcliffiella horikoshii TaxID=79883 RepID=UPI001653CE54|nr:hypothetical protein [Sutcliffiella horikoshii]
MDILDKLSVIELKQKVLLILKSIKNVEQQYKMDNIYEDIKEILNYLDAIDNILSERLE